mmetsp:Transcript_30733/g.72213  ORF Transcript_30733/g.72213 Transcript_30733/m.72213 type:complete len:206 (-) Transcript_30733:294-911(-)
MSTKTPGRHTARIERLRGPHLSLRLPRDPQLNGLIVRVSLHNDACGGVGWAGEGGGGGLYGADGVAVHLDDDVPVAQLHAPALRNNHLSGSVDAKLGSHHPAFARDRADLSSVCCSEALLPAEGKQSAVVDVSHHGHQTVRTTTGAEPEGVHGGVGTEDDGEEEEVEGDDGDGRDGTPLLDDEGVAETQETPCEPATQRRVAPRQ